MSAESESPNSNIQYVKNILNNTGNKYNFVMVIDNSNVNINTQIAQNLNFVAKYLGISDVKYMNILIVYLGQSISSPPDKFSINIIGGNQSNLAVSGGSGMQVGDTEATSETDYNNSATIMNKYNSPSQSSINKIYSILSNPNSQTDSINFYSSIRVSGTSTINVNIDDFATKNSMDPRGVNMILCYVGSTSTIGGGISLNATLQYPPPNTSTSNNVITNPVSINMYIIVGVVLLIIIIIAIVFMLRSSKDDDDGNDDSDE